MKTKQAAGTMPSGHPLPASYQTGSGWRECRRRRAEGQSLRLATISPELQTALMTHVERRARRKQMADTVRAGATTTEAAKA